MVKKSLILSIHSFCITPSWYVKIVFESYHIRWKFFSRITNLSLVSSWSVFFCNELCSINTLREEIFREEIFTEEIFAEFIFAILAKNCEIKFHETCCSTANIILRSSFYFYMDRQWIKCIKYMNIAILSSLQNYKTFKF